MSKSICLLEGAEAGYPGGQKVSCRRMENDPLQEEKEQSIIESCKKGKIPLLLGEGGEATVGL